MKTATVPEINWAEMYGRLCEAVSHAGFVVTYDSARDVLDLTPATPSPERRFTVRYRGNTDENVKLYRSMVDSTETEKRLAQLELHQSYVTDGGVCWTRTA